MGGIRLKETTSACHKLSVKRTPILKDKRDLSRLYHNCGLIGSDYGKFYKRLEKFFILLSISK